MAAERKREPALERARILERVLRLRGFALLQTVPLESLEALAQAARVRRLSRGEVLVPAGETWRALTLPLEETLRTRPAAGAQAAEPELLGALSLWSGRPLAVDVVAEASMLVLQLTADTLSEVLEGDASAMLAVLRASARLLLDAPVRAGGLPPGAPAPFGAGSLDLVQRMLLLQRSLGLARASVTALADAASSSEEVRLEQGARLWAPGDPVLDLVLVAAGRVVLRTSRGQEEQAGPYGVLGALDVMAGTPRRYEAWAEVGGATVLRVPAEHLLGHLEDHVEVALDLLGLLARENLRFLMPPGQDPVGERVPTHP
ncbi:MAG TPA: cyclic nucleotide-binding domain-containing protein [Aggregicoccus sp.]|nr:cyclic nucleotide-binding domain-containing protein [Aggregicoccus sp.]